MARLIARKRGQFGEARVEREPPGLGQRVAPERLEVGRLIARRQVGLEPVERHVAPGKHPEIAVQGEDELVFQQRGGRTHRDSLLADARKPLAHLALAQQEEHLLLDHAGLDQAAVERQKNVIGQVAAIETYGGLAIKSYHLRSCFIFRVQR